MTIESLIIRVKRKGVSKQESQLAEILTTDDETQLNFGLPEFCEWPQGSQSMSLRGRLLMLAGLKYLQKHYPTSVGQVQPESQGIESTEIVRQQTKTEPKLVSQTSQKDQHNIVSDNQWPGKSHEKKNKPDFDLSMFQ